MSENAPIEALRAFASTKPVEFDSFMRRWDEDHPPPPLDDDTKLVGDIYWKPEEQSEDKSVDGPSKKRSKVAAAD
jgi:hypothetical protein